VAVTVPASPAAPLAISLFGPWEVCRLGEPLPRLHSRKGQWLLALLTLRHGREVERAWLAAILWPESAEGAALANLRNSLTDLRSALGPEADRLRSPSPHTLALDLTGAAADVVAFDQAIAEGETAALERAAALYRGPLLEGCAEEWAFQDRAGDQSERGCPHGSASLFSLLYRLALTGLCQPCQNSDRAVSCGSGRPDEGFDPFRSNRYSRRTQRGVFLSQEQAGP
jgi:hypothetical protein